MGEKMQMGDKIQIIISSVAVLISFIALILSSWAFNQNILLQKTISENQLFTDRFKMLEKLAESCNFTEEYRGEFLNVEYLYTSGNLTEAENRVNYLNDIIYSRCKKEKFLGGAFYVPILTEALYLLIGILTLPVFIKRLYKNLKKKRFRLVMIFLIFSIVSIFLIIWAINSILIII